mmetsp:Transcript_13805/g.29913  ORF Transcript_13805/g.29913 Transcript_13805/m.29913 type:complete len:84 (-) Transcript_13805:304-555(-)
MAPKRKGAPPPQTLAPAAAKKPRTTPFRTAQTPFERAAQNDSSDDEVLYKVERILNLRFDKGVRQYLVKWEGYADKDNTWEPM